MKLNKKVNKKMKFVLIWFPYQILHRIAFNMLENKTIKSIYLFILKPIFFKTSQQIILTIYDGNGDFFRDMYYTISLSPSLPLSLSITLLLSIYIAQSAEGAKEYTDCVSAES